MTKDMTAGQKVFISGLIAACFLGYLASGSVEEYIRGQADIQMSQEETKRLDVLLRRVTHAGEESTGNFVKAAKGAESVSSWCLSIKIGARLSGLPSSRDNEVSPTKSARSN